MKLTSNSKWHAIARAEGITEKDRERIHTAFVYDGFRTANDQPES